MSLPPRPTDGGDREAMAARYARREALAHRYAGSRPEVQRWLQERRAGLASMFAAAGWRDLGTRSAVEVGCGSGGNLSMLVDLGFQPARLRGADLLPERIAAARAALPAAVQLEVGDATALDVAPGSQDLVLQFTVFSSLLQEASRRELARAMWRWLAPGGAVLSYDFCIGSPRNRDVRALGVGQLRTLFPEGRVQRVERLTLAPPLARAAMKLHPSLYSLLVAAPWLRSHRLVWIQK